MPADALRWRDFLFEVLTKFDDKDQKNRWKMVQLLRHWDVKSFGADDAPRCEVDNRLIFNKKIFVLRGAAQLGGK